MAEKRVPVLAPDPETGRLRFATVNESDAAAVKAAGGKLLTKGEALAEEQRQAYDQKSTAEKVGGAVAGLAAGPIVGNALAGTGTIAEAPEVQAFNQGQTSALTAGLDQVAVHHVLKATVGKAAADAYAKNQREIAEANPDYKTAGEVTGFAAAAYGGSGATGALRALPGLGIGAVGAGAEGLAARGLAGVATRGVLGRALATGGELAARGAAEGAMYGAANEITEADLGDRAPDKLFAAMGHGAFYGGLGGAVLGTGGSLAKSAVSGTANAARSGLARVLSKGEEAAADVGGKSEALATGEAGSAARGESKAMGITDAMKRPDDFARYKSNEMAVDALGATKTARSAAVEHVAGREQAVGNYLHENILPKSEGKGIIGSALNAGAAGRADELLPAIQADKYGRVATGISDAVKGTPADVELGTLADMIEGRYQKMLTEPTQIAGADAFRNRITTELGALGNAGKIRNAAFDQAGNMVGGTVSASDLFYTRAALEGKVYELSKNSTAAGQAYKGFLRDLDAHIVDTIDKAAAEAGNEGAGDAIRYWKRQWQLASAAEKMAEDGVERIQGNKAFSLTDKIVGSALATAGSVVGGPVGAAIGGVGGAVASKVIRGRSDAAAAVLLRKSADLGVFSRTIKAVDNSIGRASQGLLAAPKRGPLPELPAGSVRARAEAAVSRIAEAKADPQSYLDRVARETEPMTVNAPELAGAFAQKATDYLAFMDARIPSPPPPDPLDPHAKPRLTDAEASKVARYDWYWQKPQRFFDEIAHGHLTFEGIEVAQAACPGAFVELQQRTAEALAQLGAQGRKPPFAQRQKLGDLLGFAATPAQAADHVAFLQKNAMLLSQSPQGPAPAPKRASTSITPQRSPLDRLEASGPGRR